MNHIYSKDYQNLINIYNKLHNEGNSNTPAEQMFDGKSLKMVFVAVKQVIEHTKSKSLIDFGCGKAKYYFNEVFIENNRYKNIYSYWGIDDIFLYDPGFHKFKNYPPNKADGVLCVDVVEHIPEQDVVRFVEEIFSLANKFVFIVIACYKANKYLPDGRNVHLSIKTPLEWKEIISKIRINYPSIRPYIICAEARKKFIQIT